MASIGKNIQCCGIYELVGVEDYSPEDCIAAVKHGGFVGSHVIFSVTHRHIKDGLKLAQLIRRKKLGSVIKGKENRNPNSGNRLTVWTWAVNMDRLRNHV